MRMLFLYRGWNSGTNQAILNAWRKGSPEINIIERNVCPFQTNKIRNRLAMLPYAFRQNKISAIWKSNGQFSETTKRSKWCMNQIHKHVTSIQKKENYDFTFCVGSVIPLENQDKPYFIYTDLAIKSNLYYPEGQQHVNRWQECLPYEEETLKNASLIFTMSSHVSKSLTEHYNIPPSQILKVNGGCNVPNIKSTHQNNNQQNILFVGVDWERKGGPELLHAFKKLRSRHPKATLTIVGCSPKIEGPGIQIVGKVPQDQISYYMSLANLFCMPSKREPFGIAYLEAMLAGLPVIASNYGATPDFIRNGENGYRVNPNDINELAEKIEEIITNPEKAKLMGKRGQNIVKTQYTWQLTQKQMVQAIRQILNKNQPQPEHNTAKTAPPHIESPKFKQTKKPITTN